MKIIYLLQVPKNKNTAAYNRVKLFVKGLRSQNIKADIYLMYQFKNRYINYILTIFYITKVLVSLLFFKSTDFLIIYGESVFFKYIIKLNIFKRNILVERNEYSTYLIRENLSDKYIKKILQYEKEFINISGLITCSNSLKNYYSKMTKAPIFLLPLVVDFDLFKSNSSSPEKYICYCGDFGGNKDGVLNLLDSFNLFLKDYPDFLLYLIGDTTDMQDMNNIYLKISKLNLSKKVILTGRLEHKEIPKYLYKASILVLARPNNKQAEGGIPSKIAEYVSTGRPTLTTDVGELNRYFTHNKNIFFAKPDDVVDFADKMKYIISNYKYSESVSNKGVEIIKMFDYKYQSKLLFEMLLSIRYKN